MQENLYLDKYRMTREANIFVAKRNIVDYIYKSAKLEGLNVTFPETQAIYNGMSVSGVTVDEIIAVNNLKKAWEFTLDTVKTEYQIDYALICKINQYIGSDSLIYNAGYLRGIDVKIGGTDWRPDLPIESQIKEELEDVFNIEGTTKKAMTLMFYCMRKQMFLDGNKRTSMMGANQIMVSGGAGIISVPLNKQVEFYEKLVEFYESNEMEDLKKFIYEHCIDGMELE